jgi:hypothetical protein
LLNKLFQHPAKNITIYFKEGPFSQSGFSLKKRIIPEINGPK